MQRPAAPFLILTAVVALVLAAFTWPSARMEPHDVPLGAVGPVPPALAQGDAFDVRRYASDAGAREAIRDREVYGAVSAGTLYVATAASPAVAAALREAVPAPRVVDVAPPSPGDPRVATLPALALPMMLIGIVTAILGFFTAPTVGRRLALLGGGAAITGVLAALFTQTWLDALPGSWIGIAGAAGLTVLAVSATVTGLASALGRPGIGLGAVVMMLIANPWSGLASAPELLPEPAGAIGQLLPAGAGGNLLRSIAFFDGRGGGEQLLVLAAWALAGLALVLAAGWRRERATAPRATAAIA